MSLQENLVVNWWLLSERKYATFQRLVENQCLNFDQVRRIKTAWACYEVVPSVIMTPIIYKSLRVAALMPTSYTQVHFGKIFMLAVMSYVTAIVARDAVYWPIVAKVYAEVNRIDTQRAYECK